MSGYHLIIALLPLCLIISTTVFRIKHEIQICIVGPSTPGTIVFLKIGNMVYRDIEIYVFMGHEYIKCR